MSRKFLVAALFAFNAALGQAQQPTQSPQQAIQASGLTTEQIRARLRAAGYPESTLDQYLPGTSPSPGATPSPDAMAVLTRIGVIDAQAQAAQAIQTEVAHEAAEASAAASGGSAPGGPKIFGLDLFQRSTTQFDPTMAGPVDPDYRVGPRDVLALILTGGVEAAYTLDVTPEGFVVIPQVGQMYVANLTLDQITDLLFARLGRVYSGVRRGADASTRFSVSVARVRTNQVFVIGDATVPGSYQVSAAGTMLTALYAAGGPTPSGSMRHIELRRGGRVVSVLDAYEYLIRGDASRDSRLQSGDVIFVPFHGKHVTVSGEVGRSATYELRPHETLADLLRYAGGFRPTANRQRVQVERILPPEQRALGGRDRVVIDVRSDSLINGAPPPFPLEPGDRVQVFGISEPVRNRIVVNGNVWLPGEQGLVPGMRVSDALRSAGGVRPDVHLDQVLVQRLMPSGERLQLRTSLRDTSGAVTEDIPLQENDVIRVFSKTEFSTDRYVAVVGAVRDGGRIPYREGMTLRDALQLVGGVTEAAYLNEAEIARLEYDGSSGMLSNTVRVPLDSTYLFERGADGRYLGPPGLPAPTATAPEVELKPYDNVLILRQPEWQLHGQVRVGGEVRFPGEYTLTRRDERLADIIRRAGGLTTHAYPEGAMFTRADDNVGRIDIDLTRALRSAQSSDNVVLLAGDAIVVPQFSPFVKVNGAVAAPTSVAYVRGANINYYIESSGGALPTGNLHRAYVTQPNGGRELYRHRWGVIPDRVPVPLAGAEITVPVKPEEPAKNTAEVARSVAQVVGSLVTIVLLLTRN